FLYAPSPFQYCPFHEPVVLPPIVVTVSPLTATTISTCVPPLGPYIAKSPTWGVEWRRPRLRPHATCCRHDAVSGKSLSGFPPACRKTQQVNVAHQGCPWLHSSPGTVGEYFWMLFPVSRYPS